VKAKNLGSFGLLVATLFSVRANAVGADAKTYWIHKEQDFRQTNAGDPTPISLGFGIDCGVDSSANTPGLLLAGTLQLPDDSTVPLAPYENGDLDFEGQWFATEAAMDAAFPNGTYTFTVETAHDGTRILPLTLAGNAYPSTPHIANWTATQNVNPDADFTLAWDAITGGTTNDVIGVLIGSEDSDESVYKSPGFLDPNRLTGTNSSFTIPAGILLPSTNYEVWLSFLKLADLDTTTYPNALGVAYYNSRTRFTIRTANEGCTFTLKPTSINLPAKGGSKTVKVKAQGTDCAWTAVSNDSFITITSGSSGTGSGMVRYSVPGNTNTAPLTGTMTIAGQTFTVNQARGGCKLTLSPKSAKYKAAGGSKTVKVKANLSDCAWTAVSNDSFITITAGSSGTGNGTVSYTVAPNTTARTGTMTIAGETYSVTQAAAK